MMFIHSIVPRVNMITFDDFREKLKEVTNAQSVEREKFQNLVKNLTKNIENSLDLKEKTWSYPGANEYFSYVFLAKENSREIEKIFVSDLHPELNGEMDFYVGITVDKNITSYPKSTFFSKIKIRKTGDKYVFEIGNIESEIEINKNPSANEMNGISEAIKQNILNQMSAYIPND